MNLIHTAASIILNNDSRGPGTAPHIKATDWTRADLIAWLTWNDRNGCYSDEDSTAEFGAPATDLDLLCSALYAFDMDALAELIWEQFTNPTAAHCDDFIGRRSIATPTDGGAA